MDLYLTYVGWNQGRLKAIALKENHWQRHYTCLYVGDVAIKWWSHFPNQSLDLVTLLCSCIWINHGGSRVDILNWYMDSQMFRLSLEQGEIVILYNPSLLLFPHFASSQSTPFRLSSMPLRLPSTRSPFVAKSKCHFSVLIFSTSQQHSRVDHSLIHTAFSSLASVSSWNSRSSFEVTNCSSSDSFAGWQLSVECSRTWSWSPFSFLCIPLASWSHLISWFYVPSTCYDSCLRYLIVCFALVFSITTHCHHHPLSCSSCKSRIYL